MLCCVLKYPYSEIFISLLGPSVCPPCPSVVISSHFPLSYQDDIALDDAVHRAIRILKEGFQGEMDETNIEISIVNESGEFKTLAPARIKDFLEEV